MSKAAKPLTEAEQFALRNHAKEQLQRVEALLSDNNVKETIDVFKTRFSICEIVYKVILEKHQENKGVYNTDRLQISMTQVPYALDFAGYDFDRELLDRLFGSEKRKGRRSVKKLRDLLTHKLSDDAAKELVDRKDEIFKYMDTFIDKIRNFDLDV